MNFRERHLAIFRRQPQDRVLWQPRLEHWIAVNTREGTLPEHFQNMSALEIYDDLHCSIRGYHLFNPCLTPVRSDDIETTVDEASDGVAITTKTPVGTVSEFHHVTPRSRGIRDFPIKKAEDIPVIEYVLRHTDYRWDEARFNEADTLIGERAAPTLFMPRINIQRCIIQFTGFETFHYLLHDSPAAMESLLHTIDETDDKIFDVVCNCPVEIINFGDNLAAEFLSPKLFEKWLLPVYQRRSDQLRRAGKASHSHWDGSCRMLLPYIKETGLDGIEALTPQPQGDVTLQEIRAAMGEKQILLDGIPCTHFMPQHTPQELADFTREIIDLFAPYLVLGISDEISPPGDIEKVRLVSELVESIPLD